MHTIPLIEAVGAFDLFVGGSKGESLYAQILIAPTVVQSHPLAASGLARIPFARTQIVCAGRRGPFRSIVPQTGHRTSVAVSGCASRLRRPPHGTTVIQGRRRPGSPRSRLEAANPAAGWVFQLRSDPALLYHHRSGTVARYARSNVATGRRRVAASAARPGREAASAARPSTASVCVAKRCMNGTFPLRAHPR
jgi:hypothetical protein